MIRVFMIALTLVATPALSEHSPQAVAATISGIASRAKDGDGVMFGAVEVRLRAVAAPEDRRGVPRTPEGRAATAALDALIHGRCVVCHLDGTIASSGRDVGTCYVDGQDVAAHMVALGLARACPTYGEEYVADEAAAIAAGRDLSLVYTLPSYCVAP